MVKFGISMYSLQKALDKGEITVCEGISALADMGAEVIEFTSFVSNLLQDEESLEKIKQTAKDKNVTLANYSVGANFLQPTKEAFDAEINTVKNYILQANKLGIKTVRSDSAWSVQDTNIEFFQKDLEQICEGYKQLCDFAKDYDITILLENHGFYVNGNERVRQVLKEVNKPNFGLQLDVGNFICVDDDCVIAVKKLVEFATVVHFKDFYVRPFNVCLSDPENYASSGAWFKSKNGTNLRGSIVGCGDLDLHKIMKIVKDSGFDGNMFIEFEGIEDCFYGTHAGFLNMKKIYELS